MTQEGPALVHTRRILRHFRHLAKRYDRRWSHYLQRTLSQAVEALKISGAAKVLDIGCGTGEFERLARERFGGAVLIGLDVTPQMLAIAREKFLTTRGVSFLLAQADTLPFASASLEAVVSCNMLHHVHESQALLSECARVLRPQGQLVIVDWCRDFLHGRLAHYWLRLTNPSYVKMYRVNELAERLSALGLVVRPACRFFVSPYFGMMRVEAEKP